MNETITKPLCKDCGKPIFKFEGYMHELELGVQSAAAYPGQHCADHDVLNHAA